MKELVNIASYYPELKDIAQTIVDEAVYQIEFGFQNTKAPFITGNLRDVVKEYNSRSDAAAMLENVSAESIDITFLANPKGAEYGYFVVTGTSTSQKYGKRDYGAIAVNSQEVNSKIRSLQREIFKDTGEFLNEQIQNTLQLFPKKV
jgi:hypothetical protein